MEQYPFFINHGLVSGVDITQKLRWNHRRCQADLNVGSRAQIVGLQRAVELNGVEVVVLEEEEGRGRLGYGKPWENLWKCLLMSTSDL